jgi:DNA-binding MarR family transcriptional regulator
MIAYQLLRQVLDKLEHYQDSVQDKKQLNLSGFTAFLATSDMKHFESDALDAGDNTTQSRDARLELEKNPGSIDTTISQMVIFMNRYAKQYIKKALKDSEIKTMDEFSYLSMLLTFGQLSKIELINKNMQEKTTGIETIKRLLKYEFVSQRDNPKDKRSQLLLLTEKGKTVLYGVFENMHLVSKVISGNLLDVEKIQLAYLLKKLDIYHNEIFVNRLDESLESFVFENMKQN